MLFLLIFPVLIAGFLACHIHPYHSYKLHRYEGQYLYLKSSELGLKCFGVAFTISLILYHVIPSSLSLGSYSLSLTFSSWLSDSMLEMGAQDTHEASKMAWFFILSALTLFSALIIKFWGHVSLWRRFGVWNTRVFVIGELLEDSPLDNLLFNLSLQKNKYAMLGMSDRKVYVGKVISLGEPTETNGMDQDISIMPIMSGYRDKDTLRVHFSTFYDEVDTHIYLSLRQDAIVSATEFDFVAYRKWNPSSDHEEKGHEEKNESNSAEVSSES